MHPRQQMPRLRADRQPDAEFARASADGERQHARDANHRNGQGATAAKPPKTRAFSRSGVSTSARMSSSVAARSTGWSDGHVADDARDRA